MPKSNDPTDLRNELISLARYGEITPDEAEERAKAAGLPPFERSPKFPQCDPFAETRWSIVMTIAWIAWRDATFVRENSDEFCAMSTHWIFQEWAEPVANGKKFERRAGWFLETWSVPTTIRLSLLEKILELQDELPRTRQMSILNAEKELWTALSEGLLVAEALKSGVPVDVPPREWSYLHLYEVGNRDVVRYTGLDRQDPYTNIKLRQKQIIALWRPLPASENVTPERNYKIEPHMIDPVSRPGSEGYVPLCAAVHWIMTNAGTRDVTIADEKAWVAAVRELWPLVCSGEVELIGLRSGSSLTEALRPSSLLMVRVLPPFAPIDDLLQSSPSHIACTPFTDEDHWTSSFNDQLFEEGRGPSTWTHLQLSRAFILKRWPRKTAVINVEHACRLWLAGEMRSSPELRPRAKTHFYREAKSRDPRLAKRQFNRAWDRAIEDSGARSWGKPGRPRRK